jgi:hypothetical protein
MASTLRGGAAAHGVAQAFYNVSGWEVELSAAGAEERSGGQ